MKVTDENSKIRIRCPEPEVGIRGSGSVPKCHGSATLLLNHKNWPKTHEYFFLSHIWHRKQNRNRNTLPPLGVRPPQPADQAALRGEDIRAAERRGGGVHRQHQAGLEKSSKNPGFFKKKPAQWVFLCFFGIFGFFGFFIDLPRRESFLGFHKYF